MTLNRINNSQLFLRIAYLGSYFLNYTGLHLDKPFSKWKQVNYYNSYQIRQQQLIWIWRGWCLCIYFWIFMLTFTIAFWNKIATIKMWKTFYLMPCKIKHIFMITLIESRTYWFLTLSLRKGILNANCFLEEQLLVFPTHFQNRIE